MRHLNFIGDFSGLEPGFSYVAAEMGLAISEKGYPVELVQADDGSLTVTAGEQGGCIRYSHRIQFFRGLSLLSGLLNRREWKTISEQPCFDQTGIMFDASRNAVAKPETLQGFFRRMALMGLNLGMMYTEDTYELPGQPYFGYARGRYSFDELKALDDYAYALGIELIPCIQTLGHLGRLLHWKCMDKIRDTGEILLMESEETYQFLEQMLVNASKPYRSNQIHIGMDEAADLGLGHYLEKNSYCSGSVLMQEHLKKMRTILRKHGLKAMMWSDMYFRMASPEKEYYDKDTTVSKEIIGLAPQDIGLVYWDYYHHKESDYEFFLKQHQQFPAETIFAGGIWSWCGPSMNYDKTLWTALPALAQCKKLGIKWVFATAWGDNGAEANQQGILYGMQLFAEYCYQGDYQEEQVRQRFYETVGVNPDAFLRLSAFDTFPQVEERQHNAQEMTGFAKAVLYEDPLIPLFEKDLEGLELAGYYRQLSAEYADYASQSGEFRLYFQFYAKLAEVLADKWEWRTAAAPAVRNRDRRKAGELAAQVPEILQHLNELKNIWRSLWFSTNKPYGFEILDIRLGGLTARFESAGLRMQSFADFEIDTIEELEEEKLPFCELPVWENIVSACKIAGI